VVDVIMTNKDEEGQSTDLQNHENILTKSRYKAHKSMTPVEASDEIISIFCELHGGIEAAMPMIIHQFKTANVDFANPTKEGLKKVAEGLIKVTEFLKGKIVAEKEEKRFNYIIKLIAK
jgi:hypothetical protein